MVLVFSVLLAASLACSGTVAPRTTALPTPAAVVIIPTAPSAPLNTTLVTSSEEQALVDLYARVNPSVVSILVDDGVSGSQGSGFVYDTVGHIVTNAHVVENERSIEVDFASGFKTHGRVVGVDLDSDLAVIKLENLPAEGLTPVPLGDSSRILVGQRVVAIGNPFGLAGTMTVGIVSGLGRTVEGTRDPSAGINFSTPDIIQTDAAINPGNSGGPLLNLAGEVIGINKAIETSTGVNSGVGYAIASNTVRQVVPYLIQDGKFVYPYLGIRCLEELSLFMQEELNLSQASGAYVMEVIAGGPADGSGLRADSARADGTPVGDGDLIIAINGQPVKVFADVISYLVNSVRPGDTVTLSVIREGQPAEVQVTLGERP